MWWDSLRFQVVGSLPEELELLRLESRRFDPCIRSRFIDERCPIAHPPLESRPLKPLSHIRGISTAAGQLVLSAVCTSSKGMHSGRYSAKDWQAASANIATMQI